MTGKKRERPWLGGVAAMMAVTITHPIDQTKMRTQTQRPSRPMLVTARNTVADSGIRGLWAGLTGSWLRQATYGAARFGIYAKLKERDAKLGRKGSLLWNGAVAGTVAGIVGSPAELVMVRMSADGIKPESMRFHYRNAISGLYQIAVTEGWSRCFKGIEATTLRSIVMNSTQLTSYDLIKKWILTHGYMEDRAPLHVLTAALGGTIAVTACAPVDVIKSRIQSSARHDQSALQVVAKSLQRDGISVLFRGWLPAWMRMLPTTTLTFAFYEQMRRLL